MPVTRPGCAASWKHWASRSPPAGRRAGGSGRPAAGSAERAQRTGHRRRTGGRADPVPDRRADVGGRVPAAARAGRVMSGPPAAGSPPTLTCPAHELSGLLVIAQRDVIKLWRDRPRLAVNLAFPVLLIGGLGAILQPTVGRVTGLNAVTLAFTGG